VPAPCLNVPESHMSQGPPSGPENPGEHLQVFTFTLPGGFVEPKGHVRHVTIEVAA